MAPMTVWQRIGANIRAGRKARGLTRDAVAGRTHLTAARLEALENGWDAATVDELLALLGVIGIEPWVLLEGVRWDPDRLAFEIVTSAP
jgi:transcriptional regulator with XRE-family HTH domain